MARPQIVLSPEQVVEVETLAALPSQEQIADCYGIGRRTFRAICARDEEVLVRYKSGKAKTIAHVANGLLQKARAGCKTSSIFYLKTQAGWRETADTPEPDATGSDTGSADSLTAFLDKIAERSSRVGVDRPDRQLEAIRTGEDRDASG